MEAQNREKSSSELSVLFSIFFNNIVSIMMITIILLTIIFVIDYFNLFNHMKNSKLNQEVEDALNFKGYPIKKMEEIEVQSEVIDKNKNTHILLLGGLDTGKTYFVKRYLEKNHITKYKVFCLDTDEWPDHVIETGIEKLNHLESLKDYTIILDDQGNMKLDKQVANIISKGRHFNIQLIFLAHL